MEYTQIKGTIGTKSKIKGGTIAVKSKGSSPNFASNIKRIQAN